MKKIKAIISRSSDGFYSIHCVDEMFSGGGDTPQEAKNDMLEQMKFYKETAQNEGLEYPSYLDDKFDIEYEFDVQSLLEYYSGILSLSGLEKITGIHQKQLWAYLNNKSKPRRRQIERIQKGLHDLGRELTAISL
jgi:predicted RNase H-like HicB family nuclease